MMGKNQEKIDREELEFRIRQLLEKTNKENISLKNSEVRETLEDVLNLNEKLKIKEKWFSQAQKIAKIGSWEFDINSGALRWSEEIFKTFGLSPESEVPNFDQYLEKIYQDDRHKLQKAIRDAIEEGKSYELEIRHILPDKNVSWILTIANPIFDGEKRVTKLLGITFDINERKNSELALRASEEFFKALIQNSSDYVQTVNSEGKIIYQSPTFERLTGYTRKEREGRSVIELVHPDDKTAAREFLGNIVADNRTSKTLEMRLVRKDGKVIWIESTLSNLLHEPSVGAVIVNTREITDRKTAEEKLLDQNAELKKINGELDSFVYRASHDLRAPLVSLLGLINIASLETDEAVKNKYFGLMQKSVDKLDLFIKNIIDYSRNSRLQVSITPVNFKELLYEIFDELKYMAGNDEVAKKIQVEGGGKFFTDLFRLKIIFSNIISNAVRYRNQRVESYMHVTICIDPDKAIIVFKDNGCGIEKEYQEKIFNMFFRASESNVGSGLGLYIVKQAIITLNGTINVESEIGVGTSFTIEIPNHNAE